MRVRAAVCNATATPLNVEALEIEEPRADEVLVRIVATGICHTDVAMCKSSERVPKPVVLGHEGAGVVVTVGAAVKKVKPGDHVVISFDYCGHCSSCEQGDPAYCLHLGKVNFAGQRDDGSTALSRHGEPIHSHFFGQSSFATHVVCSERNVIPVGTDVPLELLGPLGCGFQTGAGAVLNSLDVRPGSTVAVFGVGSVGLAAVMAAKVAGARRIVAIDRQASRLDAALRVGATDAVDAAVDGIVSHIRGLLGAGLNYAIDTTGIPAVIESAVECLAPHGVCGLISSGNGADISLNLLKMMLGGRAVRGIHQGDSVPEVFVPRLIELYRQGRFPFDQLVSFYALEEINQAIEDMESGLAIKPVLRMESSQPEEILARKRDTGSAVLEPKDQLIG